MAQRIKKMDPQETSLKRNRIVHDAWFAQSDGAGKEKIGQFKSQTYKGPNLGFVEITAGEINEILGYIQSHINDALQILSDIP